MQQFLRLKWRFQRFRRAGTWFCRQWRLGVRPHRPLCPGWRSRNMVRSAWTLLIDEVQYLKERELAALIVALHKTTVRNSSPCCSLVQDCLKLRPCLGMPNLRRAIVCLPRRWSPQRRRCTQRHRATLLEEEGVIDEDALHEITVKTWVIPIFSRSGATSHGIQHKASASHCKTPRLPPKPPSCGSMMVLRFALTA